MIGELEDTAVSGANHPRTDGEGVNTFRYINKLTESVEYVYGDVC